MNANDITFGIEIETTIPADAPFRVGPHGNGFPIPQLPGWLADADPSIAVGRGRRKCEFVSPVFKGADGLRQLLADLAKIRAMGAKVNHSCGLHIHVGFNRTDTAALACLTTLVSNFEKAVYASTGTHRRETGRWCNSIQRHGSPDRAISASARDRYHLVNLGSEHPTVEFRAFAGTLNDTKIVAYLRLCIGLVERALTAKRSPEWTPRPLAAGNSARRSGDGQTALARLFYALGWTKGRQPHTHGDLSGQGLPSLKQTKRELMRLARKYDQTP